MTSPLWQKQRIKEPLDESERGEWKNWLKTPFKKRSHGIHSHYFKANRLESMKTVRNFILLGSKITVDGECSHEIKKYLILGRKAMTNLDSILKSRDSTLPTMVHLVKAMVFPVVLYGCDSWTIKKAEHQRTDAFELWCWRRLLRIPRTSRRSNMSIIKEISPEHSLEGLMLKLKLQYFSPFLWRTDSLEKTLMLGKTERRKRRGQQRIRWLDGITDLMDRNLSKFHVLKDREAWLASGNGVTKSWTGWNIWTELSKFSRVGDLIYFLLPMIMFPAPLCWYFLFSQETSAKKLCKQFQWCPKCKSIYTYIRDYINEHRTYI